MGLTYPDALTELDLSACHDNVLHAIQARDKDALSAAIAARCRRWLGLVGTGGLTQRPSPAFR
jgi:hypothetical protein